MVRDEQTIDLDRVVYDPSYRRWAIEMLNRDSAEAAPARLSRWAVRVMDERAPAAMRFGRSALAVAHTTP